MCLAQSQSFRLKKEWHSGQDETAFKPDITGIRSACGPTESGSFPARLYKTQGYATV